MNAHLEAVDFKTAGASKAHYQAVPGISAEDAIEQAYSLLDSVEGCLSESVAGGHFDPFLIQLAVRAAMASCMTALHDLQQEAAR